MLTRNDGQRNFSVRCAEQYGVNEAILVGFLRGELAAACRLRASDLMPRGCNGPDGFEVLPDHPPDRLLPYRDKGWFELVVEGDRPWMPWSLEALVRELPFWSRAQIHRIVASCKKQGLIETDNFNQNPMDHRLWYTVNGVSASDPG